MWRERESKAQKNGSKSFPRTSSLSHSHHRNFISDDDTMARSESMWVKEEKTTLKQKKREKFIAIRQWKCWRDSSPSRAIKKKWKHNGFKDGIEWHEKGDKNT